MKQSERDALDAKRYRALVNYGPGGVHTYVTGIHPMNRSGSQVSKRLFDKCVDAMIAEHEGRGR